MRAIREEEAAHDGALPRLHADNDLRTAHGPEHRNRNAIPHPLIECKEVQARILHAPVEDADVRTASRTRNRYDFRTPVSVHVMRGEPNAALERFGVCERTPFELMLSLCVKHMDERLHAGSRCRNDLIDSIAIHVCNGNTDASFEPFFIRAEFLDERPVRLIETNDRRVIRPRAKDKLIRPVAVHVSGGQKRPSFIGFIECLESDAIRNIRLPNGNFRGSRMLLKDRNGSILGCEDGRN